MTSRSAIPELIVGLICTFIAWYFIPALMALQIIVATNLPIDPALQVSAALGILIILLFLVAAIYFLFIPAERIAYWGYGRILEWNNKRRDEL